MSFIRSSVITIHILAANSTLSCVCMLRLMSRVAWHTYSSVTSSVRPSTYPVLLSHTRIKTSGKLNRYTSVYGSSVYIHIYVCYCSSSRCALNTLSTYFSIICIYILTQHFPYGKVISIAW